MVDGAGTFRYFRRVIRIDGDECVSRTPAEELRSRIEQTLVGIGVSPDLVTRRGLPLYADATDLVVAYVSRSGHERWLEPRAARHWERMHAAAARDRVDLVMISGFRSFDRQLALIHQRLAGGLSVDEVLTVLAPPGCSEHHTGRAVDVGTPGCEPLSEAFEMTAAFRWLGANADRFGFGLSYPRDNPFGYCYEPWHWCCRSE